MSLDLDGTFKCFLVAECPREGNDPVMIEDCRRCDHHGSTEMGDGIFCTYDEDQEDDNEDA